MLRNTAADREAERLIDEALNTGATTLSLAKLRIVELPRSLFRLADQLEGLDLSDCWCLGDIRGIGALQRLRSLDISGCTLLSNISVLAELTNLKKVGLKENKATDLRFLSRLCSLEDIDLSWSLVAFDLHFLAGLRNLKRLSLNGCQSICDITVLPRFERLHRLNLSNCKSLKSLRGLGDQRNLRHLDLSSCVKLVNIEDLERLPHLQTLDFSWCDKIVDLKPIGQACALQDLALKGLSRLKNLKDIANLRALRKIELVGCRLIDDFEALESFRRLEDLSFSWNESAIKVSEMPCADAVKSLFLGDGAQELSVCLGRAGNFKNIKGLNFLCGVSRANFERIAGFKKLERLFSFYNDEIDNLSPLEELRGLKSIWLHGVGG